MLIFKGEHNKHKQKLLLAEAESAAASVRREPHNPVEIENLNEPSKDEKLPHPLALEKSKPRKSLREIGKTYKLVWSILRLKPILELIVIFLTVRVKIIIFLLSYLVDLIL